MLTSEQVFHADGIHLDGPDAWDHNQKDNFHTELFGLKKIYLFLSFLYL